MSYAAELSVAVSAAREAGAALLGCRTAALEVREKEDRSLVTAADLAAEAIVLRRLREAFPRDGILAEESGVTGPECGRQWIVDPLDGTTNFSRGLPFVAVSVALWEDGEPAVGVVYLPVLDELFCAVRDGEATLNGQPVRVSDTETVAGAMINCYFDRHRLLEPGLQLFQRVALACEGRVKNLGSTAGMLCYTACGRLDAFVKNGTKVWDFAAGALILQRAGGRITDFAGQPLRESGQSLLATNGIIHHELAAIIRG